MKKKLLFICLCLLLASCGTNENSKDIHNREQNSADVMKEEVNQPVEKELGEETNNSSGFEIEGFWASEDSNPIEIKRNGFLNKGSIKYINGHEDITYEFEIAKEDGKTIEAVTTSMSPQLDVFIPENLVFTFVNESQLEVTSKETGITNVYTKSTNEEITNALLYYELPVEFEVSEEVKRKYNEDIMSLNDPDIFVSEPKHHYSSTNSVSLYLVYQYADSVQVMREKLLAKMTEINKLSQKYQWISQLTINAYQGQQENIYQVTSYPLQRERMVENNMDSNDLAAYVCHFGVDINSAFYTDHDESIFCEQGRPY